MNSLVSFGWDKVIDNDDDDDDDDDGDEGEDEIDYDNEDDNDSDDNLKVKPWNQIKHHTINLIYQTSNFPAVWHFFPDAKWSHETI